MVSREGNFSKIDIFFYCEMGDTTDENMSSLTEIEQTLRDLTLLDGVRQFCVSTKAQLQGYVENSVTMRLKVVLEHYTTNRYIRRGWMPKGCLGKALDSPEFKLPLFQSRNDIEGHPATSTKQGRVLERTILKMLGAIKDNRLVWSPNWVPFFDFEDLDTKDWDMEVLERREIGVLTSIYRHTAGTSAEEQIALSQTTDFQIFQAKEGYREWALSKFLENFMRQWFTSYTGDPRRDGETCKKRAHGKTRFRWAFCEGPTAPAADVVEMLMGMYEEAEGEINDEATKNKKQNKINRERSTVLAQRVKVNLHWADRSEINLDARISGMEQELERLKGKKKEVRKERDWCENQRAAFLMPLVSKDLWNVFKESGENAGERVFERPSNTTVRMVQVLKGIHWYGKGGFDFNRDVWAVAHPELVSA